MENFVFLTEFLPAFEVAVKSGCWLGHVVRMEKDAPARRVFDAGICGCRRKGRPYIRWKDQIEEALSSIGVTNWRRRAKSRSAWKEVLRQAEIR